MSQIEIHLAPLANLGIFEIVVVDGVFSAEACDELRERARPLAWQPGEDPSGHGGATWVTQPLPTTADQTPIPELARVLAELNATRFRINATELAAHDPPMLTRYPAGCPGRVPRLGLVDEFSTRKLGFVVALDPPAQATGANVSIAGREYELPLGSVAAFPALQRYGVTAVVAGRRDFVEGWLHGPAWV